MIEIKKFVNEKTKQKVKGICIQCRSELEWNKEDGKHSNDNFSNEQTNSVICPLCDFPVVGRYV